MGAGLFGSDKNDSTTRREALLAQDFNFLARSFDEYFKNQQVLLNILAFSLPEKEKRMFEQYGKDLKAQEISIVNILSNMNKAEAPR